jgi:FAD/FMN-containing dehydrogenase
MKQVLTSWGRLSHAEHAAVPLHDRGSVAATMARSLLPGVPHAAGRSYGDQALNAGGTAWLTRGLDKFIAFDRLSGRLHCEAGVTLAQVIDVVLPHGWFLPVTPGTRFATVGGAIANDVHGKNHHHHGTFGEHVMALTLARTDGQVISCSSQHNADWLAATIGGMGLTGVIVDAEIQLRRVAGPWIDARTETFESLEEFFALSAHPADASEYSVAWIDCMASRRGHARGAFFCGNHAMHTEPLPRERTRSLAWLPPLRWVNSASSRAFNTLYFQRQRMKAVASRQSYRSFFYPLDGLMAWNRIYGKSGFYQYQCVIPQAVQAEGIRTLLREIAASQTGSFLSVLKTFGPRPPRGLLSFPMAGTTLALDFPNRGPLTLQLFERLNAVVSEAGGRLYAAKDATMPAEMWRQGYPGHAPFERYRDPGISSEMSRRLMGS